MTSDNVMSLSLLVSKRPAFSRPGVLAPPVEELQALRGQGVLRQGPGQVQTGRREPRHLQGSSM